MSQDVLSQVSERGTRRPKHSWPKMSKVPQDVLTQDVFVPTCPEFFKAMDDLFRSNDRYNPSREFDFWTQSCLPFVMCFLCFERCFPLAIFFMMNVFYKLLFAAYFTEGCTVTNQYFRHFLAFALPS